MRLGEDRFKRRVVQPVPGTAWFFTGSWQMEICRAQIKQSDAVPAA